MAFCDHADGLPLSFRSGDSHLHQGLVKTEMDRNGDASGGVLVDSNGAAFNDQDQMTQTLASYYADQLAGTGMTGDTNGVSLQTCFFWNVWHFSMVEEVSVADLSQPWSTAATTATAAAATTRSTDVAAGPQSAVCASGAAKRPRFLQSIHHDGSVWSTSPLWYAGDFETISSPG